MNVTYLQLKCCTHELVLISPLQFSPAKERGKGPSLGCAVEEEDGYSKGKMGGFFVMLPHIFLVIFVLQTEAKGIKRINSFVWKGSTQKKVVLNKGRAELPQNKGGLAIPNLNHFWDGLKLAWLSRLFQVHDDTTWKRLAMSKISLALKLPGLTLERLLLEGPESISRASSLISNPFWQAILKHLPTLERTFYSTSPNCIGERVIWDNMDFLHEGEPFKRKFNNRLLTHSFKIIKNFEGVRHPKFRV